MRRTFVDQLPRVAPDGSELVSQDILNDDTGAADIGYDNAVSGLNATDVQAAIDEIAAGSGGGGLEFITVAKTVTAGGYGSGTISLDTGDATLKLGAILGFSITWVAGSSNINPTILAPRNNASPGPKIYGGVMNGGGVSASTPTKYGPQTSDMGGASTVPWSFVGQATAGVIEMEFSNCAENDQFTMTAKILKLF